MGSIFKNLKGTTSNTFTVGKPSNPDYVVGLVAWDTYKTAATTSATSWQEYRKNTFYLPKGIYRIGFNFTWGYSSTSYDIRVECRFDNTQVAFLRQEPKDGGSNQRYWASYFDYVEVDTDGDYVMDIRYKANKSSHTARMYASVMEIWRVL